MEDSAISETVRLSVQEFERWFEKETNDLVKPLDKEATGLIEDIRKKISQVEEACRNLIKESEKELEKGKAYHRSRAAKKLAQFFIDTLNHVAFPEQISLQNTEELLKNLNKALSTVDREKNIWFPRISPMFIMTRRKIDVVLSKLYVSVEKLDEFASQRYSKVKNVANCFAAIDTITQLKNELKEIEKERNDTENMISEVVKETEETKQKILYIQQKDEVKELLKINREAKELANKIKYELRYLQKPFIKLQNLYHSGAVSIPAEETQKLSEYLANPFLALAKEEQSYPILRKILQRVNESMEQDKLKIKSSRQKKAQDQINSILKTDALLSLQQQCKQIYERRKQLLSIGNIIMLKNETTRHKILLKDLQRQLEHLNSKLSSLQNNLKEKKNKLEMQKKELEKATFEVTKKNIQLNI